MLRINQLNMDHKEKHMHYLYDASMFCSSSYFSSLMIHVIFIRGINVEIEIIEMHCGKLKIFPLVTALH